MAKSLRSMALCAWSNTVLIAGICGSSSTAYQPRFFVLEPVANTLAMVCSHRLVDAIGEVAQQLAQGKYAQALALATPVQQGVKLRAEPLADGRRQTNQFAREFVEGVAQAKAQTCLWKQRPHAADGAVKAIGQDTSHLVRRLMR